MQDYVNELVSAVEAATPRLRAMPDREAARRPGADRWSPKEIIGHLIDSASNNHQRFVRAQQQADLIFPGYDQEAWVAQQRYAEAPWDDLVQQWRLMNLHLARVMAATPEAERLRPRAQHNLDVIAWRTVPTSDPATLDYFMADYVGHLKHHLGQILGVTGPEPGVGVP